MHWIASLELLALNDPAVQLDDVDGERPRRPPNHEGAPPGELSFNYHHNQIIQIVSFLQNFTKHQDIIFSFLWYFTLILRIPNWRKVSFSIPMVSFENLVTPRFLKYTWTREESFIFFCNVLKINFNQFDDCDFCKNFKRKLKNVRKLIN